MAQKAVPVFNVPNTPADGEPEVLIEQLLWIIQLRWIAAMGLAIAAVVSTYLFPVPVLENPVPVYLCAGVLLLSNIIYYFVTKKRGPDVGPKDIALGMFQVETDLVILTAVLHFSGGVVNPFFLFYVFHVIIAAIILPRNLSSPCFL